MSAAGAAGARAWAGCWAGCWYCCWPYCGKPPAEEASQLGSPVIKCISWSLTTVALLVALAEATTVLLLLVVALLATILRIIALLIVLLLLVLLSTVAAAAAVRLARGEGLCAWLERSNVWSEPTLCLGGVDVELLLRLAREVLVLSSRVVLPRVKVRHDDCIGED